MRRISRLLPIFLLALAIAPQLSHAKKYTLEELLQKVNTEYPGVLAARHQLRSAETLVTQAKMNWMPQGDFSFFFTGNYDSCRDDTGATTTDCSVDMRSVLSRINGVAYGFDLTLLQPLYTFGKIESATKAAKAGVRVAEQQVEAAKQDVVYNAVRAYWGLKTTRAVRELIDEGLSKLKGWIDRIIEEMDGANKGGYTEADLARMKAALDSTELIRVDVNKNLLVADIGMKVLTNDDQADIDDSELRIAEVMDQPLSYFIEAAHANRPEAKMLNEAVIAAHHIKNWKIGELLPNFGLRVTSNYRGFAVTGDGASSLTQFLPANGIPVPMLVLNMPIDFGVRATRIQQAAADERAAVERRKWALGGIDVDVAGAYANYDEARTREKKLAHAEKVSRGWYSIVDRNMAQGLTTSTDARELTDAARTYFDFRIRHMQAINDTNVTLAWLKRTTGLK